MAALALVIWLVTAGGGLYLLAVWLIEYDRDFQTTKATRLPVPVIGTHALLAITGLVVWSAYLYLDDDRLAWTAVVILACVASLGLVMVTRWFRAGREAVAAVPTAGAAAIWGGAGAPPAATAARPTHEAVAPERHFPVSVVVGHGIFATATIILVLLTALGVGGS